MMKNSSLYSNSTTCISINIYTWETNFNHLRLKYTDSCNFLTKRMLVSQPSRLVVAKDSSNISHNLNLSIDINDYPFHYIIHTQHDCPSQMNSNLMISVTEFTRYRTLFCCC